MKSNALVVVGLLMVFVFAGVGFAQTGNNSVSPSVAATPKLSKAQAKEIALKKVSGKVMEEIVSDDEKGKILFYIFVIKVNAKKLTDVMVDANSGEIVSVEEYDADTDTEQ